MRFREVKGFLSTSKDPPAAPEERVRWLEARDIPRFLESSASEDVPIYVSSDSLYLYSAFVSAARLKGDWINEGLAWNFPVSKGWGYGYSKGEKGEPVATIFPPLDDPGCPLLDGAEPPIFWRRLEGRGQPYVELNQRFAHVAGLHRVESRGAYCRLDENGDIEDVVVMERSDSGWICTAKRSTLDFYMFLTGSLLVRVFEAMRPFPSYDTAGAHTENVVRDSSGTIFARQTLASDSEGQIVRGLLRGFQVIRCGADTETLWRVLKGEPLNPRQYATFLINDWKNERAIEWSCDPAQLGNYFVASDLPYYTSPAFFRSEVLSKYKQDTEKYELDVRSVGCRGVWSLQSFDINEEGQIHAYIGDLGHLPYSEQLHWKQFNEAPKAGISKRAFQTDFEASWDVEPDPVWELRDTLRKFPRTGDNRSVWTSRDTDVEKALQVIQHVVTNSAKEWRDAVLDLCRVVVDGLETRTLRALATSLGCDDKKLASLKLLRRVLAARGVEEAIVAEVCDPLDDVQAERSGKAAHGVSARSPAKPLEDFRARLKAVSRSMALLADLIRQGTLDLKPPEEKGA